MINVSSQKVLNYLVPSSGQTHAVAIQGDFSGVGYTQDWRQFKVDQYPFQPQGVFIDNTQNTGALTVTINPLGYTFSVPPGITGQYQFPAPNGQTCDIVSSASGLATLTFVDFPVLPNAGGVNVLNTPTVNIGSAPSLNVTPTDLAQGGVPYQITQAVTAFTPLYGTITTATSLTLTPGTSNLNLRKLLISLTPEATQTTAGDITLTIALNSVTIGIVDMYVPASYTGSGRDVNEIFELDLGAGGINAGTGSLVVTLSSALTAGKLNVNSYFSL